MLQSARDVAEKEKRGGGIDGAGGLPNRGKWKKRGKGREKGKRRGNEVFPPSAELVVERARRERRRIGLFIGQLAGVPTARYFLWPSLSSTWASR